MSKFRERAAEVKAAGEEARGDFTPNGVPKRMYQWWLEESPSEKARLIRTGQRRENFCHFWRVVLIWTPLLFVLERFLTACEAIGERFSGKQIVGAVVLFVLAIVALIVTSVGDWSEFLKAVGFMLAVAAALATAFTLLFLLIEKTDWGFPVLMSALGIGALVFITYAGFQDIGWWVFLVELGVVAGLAALIGLVILVGTALESWRADARKKRVAAEEEAWEAYFEGTGPDPSKTEPKEPGKVSKFFSGVGDFFVLLTQVVRVNKWKICPLVEVEPVQREEPEPFRF